MRARTVVLLCGPPGAGKTTIARQSDLTVYDSDDPQWAGLKQFNTAIAGLRDNPSAQAVVIRTGATASARRKAAQAIGATHVYLLDPGQAACLSRVKARGRASRAGEIQGVLRWYATHDLGDGARPFPGWDDLDPPSTPPPPPPPSRPRARPTPASRGYGAAHRAERRRWQPIVDAGRAVCARCGRPIAAGSSWDLGHNDERTAWTGPEHPRCNRGAGGRNGWLAMRESTQMVRRSWA